MTTLAQALSEAYAPLAGSQDPAKVTQALSWAESFITEYCDRTFDLVTGDIELVDPISGTGLLKHLPIVQVTLVEGLLPTSEGMTWTTLTNYGLVKATGLVYNTTGLPGTTWTINTCGTWPTLPEGLRVTYDHGFQTIPKQLVDVGVRLTAQAIANPSLMVQKKVGDVEARFSGSAGVLLNQLDKSILDRYAMPGIY